MIIEQFVSLSPVLQALIATLFTYSITTLGASLVFFTRKVSQRFLNAMLGFVVMMALELWS